MSKAHQQWWRDAQAAAAAAAAAAAVVAAAAAAAAAVAVAAVVAADRVDVVLGVSMQLVVGRLVCSRMHQVHGPPQVRQVLLRVRRRHVHRAHSHRDKIGGSVCKATPPPPQPIGRFRNPAMVLMALMRPKKDARVCG